METITVNDRIFRVVRLLGKGKGGYSWLVEADGAQYVCKQIHHEPCDYYQFGDKLASELADYERLWRLGLPLPALLDVDRAAERLLKEYIPGRTVYDLVLADGVLPRHREQIAEMCRVLYGAGLNIDYFPTNFVDRDGMLFYIDYECNTYDARWDFEHWGAAYWAKTPEFLAHHQAKEE